MAQDIVCALDVRKYLATKISEDFDTAEYIEGSATLIMMSDTECLFRFETSRSSENLVAVLDDVGRFEGNLFTVFLSGKRFTFAIVDDVEYCLFVDAIQECRLLVNLAFRLDCLMRDQFFAGVYTTFAKDEDNKVLIEGIGGVRNNQHSMTTFNLFDPLLQHRKKTIVIDDHDSVDEVIDALSFHDDITNINCIFCNSQKSTEYTKKFYWHPYVPVNSKKQNVYMCYSCICNWKEYRERAVKDNQLIMVDELNEEICGICSDTPPELVMCSLCPRSFCATCLTRVLIPQEVLDLEKPQDWLCMCCTNHMDAVTPSLKNSDWKPVLPNTMNKTKSHSIIEKKTFADYFFEDVIEEIPACPRVHFLDDTMDDDDFLSDDDCEFPPQSVAIPREMGIDILCISPEEGDVTVYEVVDISEVIQCLHTAVSQEDGAEEAELHSKSPTDPVTESDSLAGAEQVQNASPKGLKCVNTEPGGTADCVISPMEDEICMLASSSSDVSTDSPPVRDEASSVTTLLVDAQLCDTAVCVLSPIFCPVSEDTHYFSQYLETHSCGREPGRKEGYPTDDVCFLCKDGGSLVECDYVHRENRMKRRCQKVYHTHCLHFKIESSVKYWRCPRHFCDYCGSSRVKIMCKYCPTSACAKCSEPEYGKIKLTSRNTEGVGMFSSSIRTIVCDSCLAITEKCIGLKLAPESQQPSHSGSHAPRTVRFVDLSPDSTIPSPSPSSSSLAPSLLSSSSSSLASYKSSSSKSPDPQEKRSLEKEKEKKLLKREQAPPKKGVKKAPTSSKKEGGKWKIGVKDQKKKIVELKEKKKKKKPGVSKVRDRDDIRNISNIGCSARATDLDMCEDGVRAPSLSLSPVPGAQARIGKRNRDCWSSDSECSGDSGIQ